MNDLVSIIVPVYNTADYLGDCLDSIINQSYNNLEIIVVDDGSVDNSKNIIDRFSLSDKRIKYIYQENQGLSAARNTGIEHSNGDWIAFVDSDDMISQDFVSKLLNSVKENKAEIGICLFQYFNSSRKWERDSGLFVENFKVESNKLIVMSEAYPAGMALELIPAWNKIYRSNIFKNIRFPINKRNEDEFVALDLLLAAQTISIVSQRLYLYRQRDNSIMHSSFDIKRFDIFDAYIRRFKLFREIGNFRSASAVLNQYIYLLHQYLPEVTTNSQNELSRIWNQTFFKVIPYFLSDCSFTLKSKVVELLFLVRNLFKS